MKQAHQVSLVMEETPWNFSRPQLYLGGTPNRAQGEGIVPDTPGSEFPMRPSDESASKITSG